MSNEQEKKVHPIWYSDIPGMLSLLLMPVMAILVVELSSVRGRAFIVAACVGFAVALAGTATLFRARLPLYRQGKFFLFGSRMLPPESQKLYRVAYALLIPSIIYLTLLLMGSGLWMRR